MKCKFVVGKECSNHTKHYRAATSPFAKCVAGLLVEIVLTFVFVLAILGVTSKKAGHGSIGGLVGAAIAAVVYKNLES